ncbi:MAG: hypothetical protein EBZ74_12950 [Planctomycetia bacterium]|nr:hypothetical protein [Planctomycetia bacterium]
MEEIKTSSSSGNNNITTTTASLDEYNCPYRNNYRTRLVSFRRQKEDERDHLLHISPLVHPPQQSTLAKATSAMIDHRPFFPYIFDQGNIGSCTANASIALFMYIWNKTNTTNQQNQIDILSRLFCYYNTRSIEGTTTWDSGASLRDTMKSLQKYGVPLETCWSYLETNTFKKPFALCYQKIEGYAVQYAAIDNRNKKTLITTLSSGLCFVFGMDVYSSFFSEAVTKNGMVPYPNINSETLEGGHALCCCGYDMNKDLFLVRNSWGKGWGLSGYCWFPSELLTSALCYDFWTITKLKKRNEKKGRYEHSSAHIDKRNINIGIIQKKTN